jgi:hypothetical protein
MRWKVESCILTNYVSVVETLETDYWFEVQDFIEEQLNEGRACRLTDMSTGDSNWAYPEETNEEDT